MTRGSHNGGLARHAQCDVPNRRPRPQFPHPRSGTHLPTVVPAQAGTQQCGGTTFEYVGKRPTSPSTHANVIAMKTNCNGPIPSVRHRVGNRAPAPGLRPAPERRWKDGRIFIVLRGLRKAIVILSEVEESNPLIPDPPHTVVPAQAGRWIHI